MGANEKLQAAMHGGEYTPDVRDLRIAYVAMSDPDMRLSETRAEFERFIAKIKAEAWDEGREAGSENQIHWNGNWYTGGHEEITNPCKEAPSA